MFAHHQKLTTLLKSLPPKNSYYPATSQGRLLFQEITSNLNHLITLLEEWNLHLEIHQDTSTQSSSRSSTPALSDSLQSRLADYNHQQQVLEIVKPYMTIASIAINSNPQSTRQSINCPYCGKFFKGPKFWKRFHQHRRDAHCYPVKK